MLEIIKLSCASLRAKQLCLQPGDAISLSAPSGAGKSVFLRTLADLIEGNGIVRLDGVDREQIAAPLWRKRVSYVGPKSCWWHETVGAHFQDEDWLAAQAPALDLPDDIAHWPASRLSSGEAQRLCLLRAVEGTSGGQVRYLLLDEPTSALDSARQKQVEALLTRYLKRKEIAILFVSHDDRQIERFAQRRWELVSGRVQEVRQGD